MSPPARMSTVGPTRPEPRASVATIVTVTASGARDPSGTSVASGELDRHADHQPECGTARAAECGRRQRTCANGADDRLEEGDQDECGQEDADRRRECPWHAGQQEAEVAGRAEEWPGGRLPDRDGIEELALADPAEVDDQIAPKQRQQDVAGAEEQRTGLEEDQEDGHQADGAAGDRGRHRAAGGQGSERIHRVRSPDVLGPGSGWVAGLRGCAAPMIGRRGARRCPANKVPGHHEQSSRHQDADLGEAGQVGRHRQDRDDHPGRVVDHRPSQAHHGDDEDGDDDRVDADQHRRHGLGGRRTDGQPGEQDADEDRGHDEADPGREEARPARPSTPDGEGQLARVGAGDDAGRSDQVEEIVVVDPAQSPNERLAEEPAMCGRSTEGRQPEAQEDDEDLEPGTRWRGDPRLDRLAVRPLGQ